MEAETEKMILGRITMWIVIVGIVMEVIGILITRERFAVSVGIVSGISLAIFNIHHINSSFEMTMLLPENKAKAHYLKGYFFRMAIAFIIFYLMLKVSVVSVLGAFAGMQSIKLATYASVLKRKQEENSQGGDQKNG